MNDSVVQLKSKAKLLTRFIAKQRIDTKTGQEETDFWAMLHEHNMYLKEVVSLCPDMLTEDETIKMEAILYRTSTQFLKEYLQAERKPPNLTIV